MFVKANFFEYKIGSKLQFMLNILYHCQQQDLPTLLITKYVEDLETVIEECQTTFKNLNKSQLTEKLQQFDDNRDRLIRGVILLCKGKALHWDETICNAANRCLEEINKYGKEIYNLSYSQETATVISLCSDFLDNEQMKSYCTLLGITDYFEHIRTENSNFESTFALRQKEKSEKIPVKAIDLLDQAEVKYKKLQDMIFSFSNVNGQEPYQALINVMNSTTVEYNQLEASTKHKTTNE